MTLTLETGRDTGSKAKLLIRLCCNWELCKPPEILRISSRAFGLISEFGTESSVARVVLVWRLRDGSISWFLEAKRTAGCTVGSCDAAGGANGGTSASLVNWISKGKAWSCTRLATLQ